MEKIKIKKQYLSTIERMVAAILGFIFLGFSVYLVISPPIRLSIVDDAGVIETTKSYSDQSTVVVFLLTAGCVMVFYAINGLRLIKFSAGPISGESESGQGQTSPLEPFSRAKSEQMKADSDPDELFESLPIVEKKIMRTLWRYQRTNFPDNFSIRWTFKVFANTPDYPAYLIAVSGLLNKALISMNPENDQCALTNEGIILMSSIGGKADVGDFYIF
jgi:hypothetical protein